ncbi:hypothetical protein L484_012800 [Morus notabilis]|uniref:Mitochondrial import inner membrane translocase subunit TIM50 n=1 Tax=Morus notabilis TaxID=981085 RepID=W9SL98_9ROSA|nr:uncharacterized protein LOC21395994 [Morus notabilis]XP_024031905.1 uncharacterized protein LOC21395994 [Morus notabilis]EXC33910.1 hypothetical protein L484_012800 [Morus notabilis]
MAAQNSDVKGKLVCSSSSSNDDEEHDHQGSEDYIYGLSLERLNLGPRKKLVVLCLGGLLCHRVHRYDESAIPRFRSPDEFYGSILVYKRPYCEEFMKFCLERFDVGIWSSAREWYLNNALDCIMKGLKSKLLFAWDQRECTNSGWNTLENKRKPLFLKELKDLWQDRSICIEGRYSSSNTLLVDNNPYKALLNPPHTAIFSDEYKVDNVEDMALGPRGELRVYLDELAGAEDVPSFVKEHPFGQSAITPAHSDWHFYSKVVRRFHKST